MLGQAAGAEQGGGDMTRLMLFFLVIGLALYFIILRPQKREQQSREKLLSSLSKGDKVITAGGIHGSVAATPSKETVEVEVAKGVRMTFNRNSISVINPDKKKPEAEEAKGAKK